MRLEETVFVAVSSRNVFRLAARPDTMPKWNRAVLHSTLQGRLASGATVLQRIDLFGHRFETEFEVTCYDPPRRVVYTSRKGPMDIEGTMDFLPAPGGTVLRWTVVGDCRGFLRVANSVLARLGRHEMRACLNQLKHLLEEDARPARAPHTRPAA